MILLVSLLTQSKNGSYFYTGSKEADVEPANPSPTYKIIEPEPVAFISYPYEWSFSQLNLQKIALNYKMSLKDASAYNIQFHQRKPILIDTLSFEKYKDDEPWWLTDNSASISLHRWH